MGHAPLSALDCNYLDASRVFAGSSDTGEYLERKDVAIASCGLPVEPLNFGFLKPPYNDLGPTVAAVRSYFSARKLPFRLTFRHPPRDDDLQRRIAELVSGKWRCMDDPTPGLSRDIPAAAPALPSGLTIEIVRTPERLVAFREAAFRAFGFPVKASQLFLNDRLLTFPHLRVYSGLVDGEVVATSMLIATGYVAGIYWVGTLEEKRGRGYAEALTWAAAVGGRDLGCEIASLQSSKMGRRVYERMGFDHVLDYRHLLPPES